MPFHKSFDRLYDTIKRHAVLLTFNVPEVMTNSKLVIY